MSEDTSVYIRNKRIPLLKYRDYTQDEIQGKTEEEKQALFKEIREYNDIAYESYGLHIIHLWTDQSRDLEFIPYTESGEPLPFTMELLEEAISFYDDKIEELQEEIQEDKVKIPRLEDRISKTNVKLYDKISDEIDRHYSHMEYCQKEKEEYEYFRNEFLFAKRLLNDYENKDRFELIYTKR